MPVQPVEHLTGLGQHRTWPGPVPLVLQQFAKGRPVPGPASAQVKETAAVIAVQPEPGQPGGDDPAALAGPFQHIEGAQQRLPAGRLGGRLAAGQGRAGAQVLQILQQQGRARHKIIAAGGQQAEDGREGLFQRLVKTGEGGHQPAIVLPAQVPLQQGGEPGMTLQPAVAITGGLAQLRQQGRRDGFWIQADLG